MLAALAVCAPFLARAQPAQQKVVTVGVLSSSPPPAPGSAPGPLLPALNALGYAEGRNLRVESRYADGKPERLPALAAELVRLPADVIVAIASGAFAARRATRNIPIVMLGVINPAEAGLVTSLARPGANITGVALDAGIEVLGKRIELLKATLPGLRRVGLMTVPQRSSAEPGLRPVREGWLKELQSVERALGLSVRPIDLTSDRRRWDQVFRAAAAERLGAAVIIGGPYGMAHRAQLAATALAHRLPTLYDIAGHVEAGGMMAYGADLADTYRIAAGYVDRILKGARPADLPVELPKKYLLTINLKTARALGITVPQSVLLRADRVIE